jgi:predicted Zn-dependent peptidase
VHTHRFANGLVLAAERRPDVRAAAFHLILPAGAATEPDGQDGLSKVLAELCYRGAGERDSRALSDALDALGLQRSGGADVMTASFGGALLADNLGEALAIHADIALRPRLSPAELPQVSALALQELRSIEDEPAQKLFVQLQRAYFTNEYGKSPLGTEESIRSLTAERLREDHAQRYRPRGAYLSVAGRFDWEWLKETVDELFGGWQGDGPARPPPAVQTEPTYQHFVQETAQEQIGVAYASVALGHPDFYSARMAVNILSGGMSARLFTEIREKRGLVYAVSASASTVEGHGYVLAYAGTTPDRAQETLDVLVRELRRLGDGVGDDEVERARVRLLSSLVMQQESTPARAQAIAVDMYLLGRVRSLEEIRAGIEAVTGGGIVDHLRQVPPATLTVATLGPRPLVVPA